MMRTTTHNRRMSLVEVTAILMVSAILAAGLSPVLMQHVRRAKLARARLDTVAIKDAILLALNDIRALGLVRDASGRTGEQCPVDLLVGDGDIPELGPEGSDLWTRGVDFTAVDFLENHLVTNTPAGNAAGAYTNWAGAYLTPPVRPDPWGNRYMVNVKYLWQGCPHKHGRSCGGSCKGGYVYDVVVLSAGADEEVDSEFTLDGFVPGDDDVICLVSRGTGPYTGDDSVDDDDDGGDGYHGAGNHYGFDTHPGQGNHYGHANHDEEGAHPGHEKDN